MPDRGDESHVALGEMHREQERRDGLCEYRQVARGKKGDTIIAFPGGKDDFVAVKEPAEELLAAKLGTAAGCRDLAKAEEEHHAE
jgi:hypothetical protein